MPIVGTEGAAGPFFSPDGEWIGLRHDGGKLRKVRPSRRWVDHSRPERTRPKCRRLARRRFHRLRGRRERPVAHPRRRWPRHRPADGRLEVTATTPPRCGRCPGAAGCCSPAALATAPANRRSTSTTSRPTRLTLLVPNAAGGWYAPTGHLLYTAREGGLFAVGFDVRRMVVTSGADVGGGGGRAGRVHHVGVGSALYTLGTQDLDKSTLVWVSRDGSEPPFATDWTGAFDTPPSRRMARTSRSACGRMSPRSGSAERTVPVCASPGGDRELAPVLDSRRHRVRLHHPPSSGSANAGAYDVFFSPTDASIPPRLLLDMDVGIWETEFSRDGEWLVGPGRRPGLVRRHLHPASAGGHDPRDDLFGQQLQHADRPLAGQPVAGVRLRSLGRAEIYVASFPDMQVKYPVSQGAARSPAGPAADASCSSRVAAN